MAKYVGALDQGTTSNRFIIFDHGGQIVAADQKEHEQIFPQPGWVEHNPLEIWQNTQDVIRGALAKANLSGSDLAAIGITNQRETSVAWERASGRPLGPAISWQCQRTDPACRALREGGHEGLVRQRTGLTIAPMFSATKMRWLLDAIEVGVAGRVGPGDGGTGGGVDGRVVPGVPLESGVESSW